MNKRILGKLVSALLIVVFAFAAFVPPAQAAQQGNTIVEIVLATNAETGEFSILIAALQAADPAVLERLGKKGPFTVFAPTDAAFKKVPASTLEALQKDRAALRNVLLYHVAAGRYPAKRVVKQTSIETLAGPRVKVNTRKGTVRVGGARVIKADVRTSNGVIHAINRVLIPPQ